MPVRPPTSWASPWCTPILAFCRQRPASIDAGERVGAGGEVGRVVDHARAARRRVRSAPARAMASASGVRDGD